MTNKTKASLRSISERYVVNQLRHADVEIPKNAIKRAVKKVHDVLIELEKAKSGKLA
jgi:hypothetical protein